MNPGDLLVMGCTATVWLSPFNGKVHTLGRVHEGDVIFLLGGINEPYKEVLTRFGIGWVHMTLFKMARQT